MVNLTFLKSGIVKLLKTLHTFLKYLRQKIFAKIIIVLFIIGSFVKFICYQVLLKVFMVPPSPPQMQCWYCLERCWLPDFKPWKSHFIPHLHKRKSVIFGQILTQSVNLPLPQIYKVYIVRQIKIVSSCLCKCLVNRAENKAFELCDIPFWLHIYLLINITTDASWWDSSCASLNCEQEYG